MKYIFKKKINTILVSLLDAVGYAVTRPWRRRPEKRTGSPKNVLIVRLDHLGDVLFSTALPQILKENFSGCRVTFLTSSAGGELLKHNSFVDEVLCYDAPWFARGAQRAAKIGFWALIGQIRKKGFDLALSLRGDLRENFLVCAGGVQERIGYGVTGGGFFLTRELVYRAGVHETRHTLDILRVLGISRATIAPRLYFGDDELSRMDQRWLGLGQELSGSWIAIQLKAGTPAKQWPRQRLQEFLGLCAKSIPQQSLCFVGDSREGFEWVDDFLKKNPALRWKNLMGQTTLRELMGLLRRSRLFIGPDSGPAHMAASFGVPTLFLFSGTNAFQEWRSLEEHADFLRHSVTCSPCHLTRCPVEGHPCMTGIEPGAVLLWIKEKSSVA